MAIERSTLPIFKITILAFFLLILLPFSRLCGMENVIKIIFLTGNFSRVQQTPIESDSIFGSFYYAAPQKVLIQVSFPLNQFMLVDSTLTQIYYPDAKKAFTLESKVNVNIPIVSALLSALSADYQIAQSGFSVYDQKIQTDTLLAFWKATGAPGSKPSARTINNIIIGKYHDRLAYVKTVFSNKDEIKTTFEKYMLIKGIYLPHQIKTTGLVLQNKYLESLILSNLEIKYSLPVQISQFKIPENVPIEKKQW